MFKNILDSKSLKILVLPRHVDDIISDLMEMDLSEGTAIIPFNDLLLEDLRVIVFSFLFMIYNLFTLLMKVDYGKI